MQEFMITIDDKNATANISRRDEEGTVASVDMAISDTGQSIGWRIRVGDLEEETYEFDLRVDEDPLSRIRQDVSSILVKWFSGEKIIH